MTDKKVIDQYLEAGKNLTPLNGSIPILTDWPNIQVTPGELYEHQGNIAWVFSKHDLVIDVDPRHGGDASFKRLLEDYKDQGLEGKLSATVVTPRGGWHIYLSIIDPRPDRKLKKEHRDYPGIEFLSVGASCTIPTSVMPHGTGTHTWSDADGLFKQSPAPGCILAMIEYDPKVSSDPSLYLPSTDAEILALLAKIDPSILNADWVRVGMAIHSHNPTQVGLDMWDRWSEPGTNYKVGETLRRWGSFTAGAVSVGTLKYLAREADIVPIVKAVPQDMITEEQLEELKARVADLNKKQLLYDFIPEVSVLLMDRMDRGELVTAIQKRLQALTGTKPAVADIRSRLKPTMAYGVNVPKWCEKWAYIDTHRGWANIMSMRIKGTESFNLENNANVPESDEGTQPNASTYVAKYGLVQTVDCLAYLPTIKELIHIDGELKMLNSYNHASVPKEAAEFTAEGLFAIERIKKHILFVCDNNQDHYEILIQWVAHQVKNTGVLLRWSPLIQSDEGAGKSFLASLVSACIGRANVGTVQSSQIKSDFNPWATGKAVTFIEELSVKGTNRHEAVNALKPLITDAYIPINSKGVDVYNTPNSNNYIAFTNHKDAIPLAASDRRWWCISAPLLKPRHLAAMGCTTVAEYFALLFNDTEKHGGEIRKFFLDFDISQKFASLGVAPATPFKDSMIETEASGMEGADEVRELLEEGGFMFNKEVLSSPHLSKALIDKCLMDDIRIDVSTTKLSILLKRLGYIKVPNTPFDYKGERVNAWSKKPMTPEQAKALLEPNSTIEQVEAAHQTRHGIGHLLN